MGDIRIAYDDSSEPWHKPICYTLAAEEIEKAEEEGRKAYEQARASGAIATIYNEAHARNPVDQEILNTGAELALTAVCAGEWVGNQKLAWDVVLPNWLTVDVKTVYFQGARLLVKPLNYKLDPDLYCLVYCEHFPDYQVIGFAWTEFVKTTMDHDLPNPCYAVNQKQLIPLSMVLNFKVKQQKENYQ